MTYVEYSEKPSTIKCLVEKSARGCPEEFAKKLKVSEKTVRRMINHLRQQGNDIQYSRLRQSYILNEIPYKLLHVASRSFFDREMFYTYKIKTPLIEE